MSTGRDQRFERHMSDTEALMWSAEKDPWLSAAMGSAAVFEKPIDIEWFRRKIAGAVAVIPRMRERVAPSVAGLAPPRWVTDPEFNLDRHIQVVRLPEPGTPEQLNALIADLFMRPFDRTAPLWGFVAVEGLEGGRGALVMKLHHSIADGTGTLRLSEEYIDLTADAAKPNEVDLGPVLAEALAANPPPADFREVMTDSLGHFARRNLGLARRIAGEVSLWGADPARVGSAVEGAGDIARVIANQTGAGAGGSSASGSPLWQQRSRHRHYETFEVGLAAAKATARTLGGSLNDWFVTAVHVGVRNYHRDRSCEVEQFNGSFVVSTRTDSAAGGNSFTPVTVSLDGTDLDIAETFAQNLELMRGLTQTARSGGAAAELLASVSAVLPASVITRAARARAARQDFATSNLRGSPIPLFTGGERMLSLRPIGPVAATAFNITALSYCDQLALGLMIDPVAVEAPRDLCDAIAEACDELARAGAKKAGTVEKAPARDKIARKKSPSKKTAATKRSPAKKTAASKKSPTKKTAAATKTATASRKAPAKSSSAKKAAAKKKSPAKKTAAKKTAAKRSARKTAARKTPAKKAAGRSGTTTARKKS